MYVSEWHIKQDTNEAANEAGRGGEGAGDDHLPAWPAAAAMVNNHPEKILTPRIHSESMTEHKHRTTPTAAGMGIPWPVTNRRIIGRYRTFTDVFGNYQTYSNIHGEKVKIFGME